MDTMDTMDTTETKFKYEHTTGKKSGRVQIDKNNKSHSLHLVTYDSFAALFSELSTTQTKISDLPSFTGQREHYNPSSDVHKHWNDSVFQIAEFQQAVSEITRPDPALVKEIRDKAEEWASAAIDSEPMLSNNKEWNNTEFSAENWDAGKIAMGDDKPCIEKIANLDLNEGVAGGAYRIIISTDVTWACSPEDAAAAIGAMVLVLQETAPVEVWVQQGWWSTTTSEFDGVTLFPITSGNEIDAGALAFWCGSVHKDRNFSYWVNRHLGRVGTLTVLEPALETNLFMDSISIPNNVSDEQAVAWVKNSCWGILYQCTLEEYLKENGLMTEKELEGKAA